MEDRISGFRMRPASHGGAGTGTKCGRWNPTTEQVKVLTDLFRSGLRTPSTDQIQKISNQLSFYGKIESKNVFYWFQNHKARERQKRRKVSMDENDFAAAFHRREDDKLITSPKRFVEVNGNGTNITVGEAHERVLETLQLFPLNTVEEPSMTTTEHHHKVMMRFHGSDQYCNNGGFCCVINGHETEHSPLDLRLSFV